MTQQRCQMQLDANEDSLQQMHASWDSSVPFSGLNDNVSVPGPATVKSVALYWSPYACLQYSFPVYANFLISPWQMYVHAPALRSLLSLAAVTLHACEGTTQEHLRLQAAAHHSNAPQTLQQAHAPSHNNGPRPTGYEPWHVLGHDWLAKHGAV